MKKYSNQQIKDFISNSLFHERTILNKDPSLPKISIVVPSYNQDYFLEKTILSILNQNYPNLELIIIDGGSTDKSLNIIKKYEKYIDYWVSEKDKGQSDALNKGFHRATGEIIGWQNSDDLYLPNCFSVVVKHFKKYPKADIIYGNRLEIDENDRIIGESRYTRFSRIVQQYDGISLGTQSTFWKKTLFSKIGFLDVDLELMMDYEFFLRAIIQKVRFKNIPYYLGALRWYETTKTGKFSLSPIHVKEIEKVEKLYNYKKSLYLPFKIYSLLFRIINYSLDGSFDYVIKGLKRRIKNRSIISGK